MKRTFVLLSIAVLFAMVVSAIAPTSALAWQKGGNITCNEAYAKIKNESGTRYWTGYVVANGSTVASGDGYVSSNQWAEISWTPPEGFTGSVTAYIDIRNVWTWWYVEDSKTVSDTLDCGPQHIPVVICHATGSETHPYQQITVDDDAVDGVGGNSDHNNDGHQNGEDIIPPGPWDPDGRNWDAAGQAIWNNGCEIPWSPPDPQEQIVYSTDCDGILAQPQISYWEGDENGTWGPWTDNGSAYYVEYWSNPFAPAETWIAPDGVVYTEPEQCLPSVSIGTDQWNHCDGWERSASLFINGSEASSSVVVDSGSWGPFDDRTLGPWSGMVTITDGPDVYNGTYDVSFGPMEAPQDCDEDMHHVFVDKDESCEGVTVTAYLDGAPFASASGAWLDVFTLETFDYDLSGAYPDPWVLDEGSMSLAGTVNESENCLEFRIPVPVDMTLMCVWDKNEKKSVHTVNLEPGEGYTLILKDAENNEFPMGPGDELKFKDGEYTYIVIPDEGHVIEGPTVGILVLKPCRPDPQNWRKAECLVLPCPACKNEDLYGGGACYVKGSVGKEEIRPMTWRSVENCTDDKWPCEYEYWVGVAFPDTLPVVPDTLMDGEVPFELPPCHPTENGECWVTSYNILGWPDERFHVVDGEKLPWKNSMDGWFLVWEGEYVKSHFYAPCVMSANPGMTWVIGGVAYAERFPGMDLHSWIMYFVDSGRYVDPGDKNYLGYQWLYEQSIPWYEQWGKADGPKKPIGTLIELPAPITSIPNGLTWQNVKTIK